MHDTLNYYDDNKLLLQDNQIDTSSVDSLKYYFSLISKYPLLTVDEEKLYGEDLKLRDTLSILTDNKDRCEIDINKVIACLCNVTNYMDCLTLSKKIIIDSFSLHNNTALQVLDRFESLCKSLGRLPKISDVNSELVSFDVSNINLIHELFDYKKYITAFQKFVNSNQRLVVSIANKYSRFADAELVDLISEGNIGLIMAINKFDVSLGNRFSSYATWWIKQTILRYLYSNTSKISVPNNVLISARKLKSDVLKLETELGRKLTSHEIAKHFKIDRETVINYMLINMPVVSYNIPIGDEQETTLEDLIQDDTKKSVEDVITDSFLKDNIACLFANLSEKELEVIKRRYGIDCEGNYSITAIAKELHLSPEKIRLIERRALIKMRNNASSSEGARALKLYL